MYMYVTVPGPVMEMAVVHGPEGVRHSTESRTQPTCESSGEPRRFKESSPAGKRLKAWFGALMNAVDMPRILAAFLDLYADKQLGEVASGAFSADEMASNVSKVQLLKTNSDFPVRKAGGKREVIPKDGKDVRSVVDNTAEVFTVVSCAGKVLERLQAAWRGCPRVRGRAQVHGQGQGQAASHQRWGSSGITA